MIVNGRVPGRAKVRSGGREIVHFPSWPPFEVPPRNSHVASHAYMQQRKSRGEMDGAATM